MLNVGNKVHLVNWPEVNHTKSKQMYWKPDQQMETERSCKILRSHGVQRKVNCQVILQSINATKTKNTAGNTDNDNEILTLHDLPCEGLPLRQNGPLRVQKELCQMFLSFNGKAFWSAVRWGRQVSRPSAMRAFWCWSFSLVVTIPNSVIRQLLVTECYLHNQ